MSLSRIIKRQIPEYIRTTYPVFVDFLVTYYKYMEENAFLDKTLSTESQLRVIIEALSSELAFNIPTSKIDQRAFLQRVKELYLAKGSEESFQYFFRAIFGKEVSIFYPKERILKTSDGEWTQQKSIYVRSVVGDARTLLDKRPHILSPKKKTAVHVYNVITNLFDVVFDDLDLGKVEQVIQSVVSMGYTHDTTQEILDARLVADPTQPTNVHELFIDEGNVDNIHVNDVVVYNDDADNLFIGYVISTTTQVKIIDGGEGFTRGKLIPIDVVADGSAGTVLAVSEVGQYGSIQRLDFFRFGYEYPRPITVSVSPTSAKVITEERGINDPLTFHTTSYLEDTTTGFLSSGYVLDQAVYAEDSDGVINCIVNNAGNGYIEADVSFTPINSSGSGAEANAIIHHDVIKQLSGLVSISQNTVTGNKYSKFLTEMLVGAILRTPAGISGKIVRIESDSVAILDRNSSVSPKNVIGQLVDGKIVGLNIINTGKDYTTPPTVVITGDGTDAEITALTGISLWTSLDYSGEVVDTFAYLRKPQIEDTVNNAIIKLYPGAVAKYPGQYASNNGFLSNEMLLQDGYYYQEYSYQIRTEMPMSEYETHVKNVIHPSGMLMFGEYSLGEEFDSTDINIQSTIVRNYQLTASDNVLSVDEGGPVDPVFEHEISADDTVAAISYGYEIDDPYTMPWDPESAKMWEDYTLGDVRIYFDLAVTP